MTKIRTKGIAAATLILLSCATAYSEGTDNGEWTHHGGGLDSNKYSPLSQVDASNVADLEVAWRWNAMDVEAATGKRTRGFRVVPPLYSTQSTRASYQRDVVLSRGSSAVSRPNTPG